MVQFLPENTASLIVIFGTFVVLFIMLVRALLTNHKIYKFLVNVNDEITTHPKQSYFLRIIEESFEKTREQTENDVNLQTFLEGYMAEFNMTNQRISMIKQLKLIQMASSLSILIGVLGTFIGLVISLSGIDSNQMSQSITNVLAGVHTAFYTSIAGIISSILIILSTKFLNSEQMLIQVMLKVENYLNLVENKTLDQRLVGKMEDVKAAILEMKKAFLEAHSFTAGFERATENMNDFNDMFRQNTKQLSELFKGMGKFTTSYNEKMDQLLTNFQKLFIFFSQQEEIQANSLSMIKETGESLKLFMERLTKEQQEQKNVLVHISNELKGTKDALTVFFETTNERLHDVFDKVGEFYEKSIEHQKRLVESQRKIEDKNTAFIRNVESATTTIKDILEMNSFDNLLSFSRSFSNSIEELQEQFRHLIQFMKKIDATQQEYKSFYIQMTDGIEKQATRQHRQQENVSSYIEQMIEQNSQNQETWKKLQQSFSTEKIREFMEALYEHSENSIKENLRSLERVILGTNEMVEQQVLSLQKFSDSQKASAPIQMLQASVSELDQTMKQVTKELVEVKK